MNEINASIRSNGSPGFTLIELLVVIAVIGVLASFLVPSILKGKSNADIARCQGNLKSIASALVSYSNENKFELPDSDNWEETLGEDYLGDDARVFHCPSDKRGADVMSYSVNDRFFTDDGFKISRLAMDPNLENQNRVSTIILVGDDASGSGGRYGNGGSTFNSEPNTFFHAKGNQKGGNYITADFGVFFYAEGALDDDTYWNLP